MEAERPIVLIILAQTTPRLPELDAEVGELKAAISRTGTYEPVVLESASTGRIFDELDQIGERVRIVHYAGHANGAGVMLKSDDEDGSGEQMAYIEGLAGRLGQLDNLQFVFLNACATKDQVTELSKAGIPAMVATQRPVKDDVAQEFATAFYKSLANNRTIGDSFKSAESRVVTESGPERAIVFGAPAVEEAGRDVSQEWPWDLYGPHTARAWKLSDFEATDATLAGEGLAALSNLAQNPEVLGAVSAFRKDFSETSEQLGILSAYKELHDLLHAVQKRCQSFLMQQAQRDDPGDVEWDDVVYDAETTLREELEVRRGVFENVSLPEEDTAWLLELETAADDIGAAREEEDLKVLKKAEWSVSRVVALRLSEMNTRLNEKARSLRLSPLLEGLRVGSTAIGANSPDERLVEQFMAGLKAMERLNEKLEHLVAQHDAWQQVDRELRLLQASVTRHVLMDLEMGWPNLKAMVEALCDAPDERWVKDLEKVAFEIEGSIESGLENKMERGFHRYFRHATNRFYLIDSELKNHCQELRGIGDQLSTVLAEIT